MDVVPEESEVLMSKAVFPAGMNFRGVTVSEIYLDGKLKKAELIDEDEKSFGIFMHSLVLSNYAEVMKVNCNQVNVIGDENEKAIFNYTAAKGFNKNLLDSIAPKVSELTFEDDNNLKISTHLINEKMRIISKGTPDELLSRCTYILQDSRFVKITRRIYRQVNYAMKDMIYRCMNVYAIAIKDVSQVVHVFNKENLVNEMTLVGLVGMARA